MADNTIPICGGQKLNWGQVFTFNLSRIFRVASGFIPERYKSLAKMDTTPITHTERWRLLRLNFPAHYCRVFIVLIFLGLPCTAGFNSGVSGEVREDAVAFYKAKAEWEKEEENFKKQDKPSKGRHNQKMLREFLRKFPESEFADNAFLMLMEEATCADWNGYPDCGVIEIRFYEEFLKRYPESEMKDEVMLKMAEAYYQMAYLWVYGKGAHSEKWSDLFRGESLKIAVQLKHVDNAMIRKGAEELEKKLKDDFKRPIAPIPAWVLDPRYF